MDCNLCSEGPENIELIHTSSEEGSSLKIQEIIQHHFDLKLNENPLQSFAICRSCCKIVCDFHHLYLKVKQTEKSNTAQRYNSDSDEPLALLRDELKIEYAEVKLEPKLFEMVCAEGWPKTQEPVPTRRSKRIVAQNQSKFEFDTEASIKHELMIPTPELIDTLDAISHQDIEHLEETGSDGNDMDVECLARTGDVSMKNNIKNKYKAKKRVRKGKKNKPVVSELLKKHQAQRSQITKEYDEFIANNFKLSCCLCHESLINFSILKRHFRSQHKMRGYAMCCGKKFIKRGVLVDHIHTHLDPDYFKCPKCNKVVASRRCLEMHVQRHDEKLERIYQCELCPKNYFRRTIFMRHLLTHTPDEEKKINCPQCEKVFVTVYTMNQHYRLVHLNMYAKVCEICGKSIRGREAFQRHQLEHNGAPKPLIECELCGIKLTTKYGLSRHMKVMHAEKILHPQVCNICSKVSPSVVAHQRHMKYVHNLERKHACPMCEKSFKRPQDLREHMTTHTGEILYTCPHCPKNFNSNANMHSHRKKVHRKEWEENRKKRYPKQGGLQAQNCQQRELNSNSNNSCKANLYVEVNSKKETVQCDDP